MNILYLLPGLRSGGTERRLVDLVAGARAAGHDVRVATMMMPRDDEANVLAALQTALGTAAGDATNAIIDLGYGGVRDWRVWPRTARALTRLRRIVRDDPPDVIHALLPSANIVAAATLATLPRRRRPALIAGREGLPTYGRERPWLVWAEDFAARWTDATLCVAGAIAGAIRSSRRAKWYRRIVVIHNGIEPAKWTATDDERDAARVRLLTELGLDESPDRSQLRIASVVANLHPYKGHADLIEAMARLDDGEKSARPALHAVCAGADLKGHLGELRRLAANREVAERVHFVGARDDVPDLLRGSDLLVSPSHEEGLSLALAEAMAARLPVIATRVGGTPEIVDDATGWLVAPQSPEELASALGEALDATPDSLLAKGEAGARKVAAEFTLEQMVARTLALYMELAETR